MPNLMPPVVKNILRINLFVYLTAFFLPIDIVSMWGLRDPRSIYFRPYQIITHLFVHGNFFHLFCNMIALATFGPILERALSSKKFLVFYFVTGIGASLLYLLCLYFFNSDISFYNTYLANPDPELLNAFLRDRFPNLYNTYYSFLYDFLHDPSNPVFIDKGASLLKYLCTLQLNIPIVGASGAIFGVLGGVALLCPDMRLVYPIFRTSVRMRYIVMGYAIYDLYGSFQFNPGDNVAHLAHLSGLLIAYFLVKILYRKPISGS